MRMFRILARSLLSAGLVLPGGCDGRACCGPPPVASVTVAPAVAALPVGDTLRLAATVKDAGNQVLTDRAVTWASSNPAVATVSATGLVTGVQVDVQAVAITATTEGVHGSAAVMVAAPVSLEGQIAFASYRDGNNEIYFVNVDGSGVRNPHEQRGS